MHWQRKKNMEKTKKSVQDDVGRSCIGREKKLYLNIIGQWFLGREFNVVCGKCEGIGYHYLYGKR